MRTKLSPLTPEQVDALRRYAKKHGRTWKSKLRDAWMGMPPHDDAGTLRGLRNSHGPTWLDRFRLPVPQRPNGAPDVD